MGSITHKNLKEIFFCGYFCQDSLEKFFGWVSRFFIDKNRVDLWDFHQQLGIGMSVVNDGHC